MEHRDGEEQRKSNEEKIKRKLITPKKTKLGKYLFHTIEGFPN